MPKCKPMNEAYAAGQAQKWREFYDTNAALFKADPEAHKAGVLQMAGEFGEGLDGDEDLSSCYHVFVALRRVRGGINNWLTQRRHDTGCATPQKRLQLTHRTQRLPIPTV